MAKFKNISVQIQVVGSGDLFSNSITFYNKKSSSDVLQLGFKADGDIVMFSVDANGNQIKELERFKYGEISEPTSTDIEDLVEQLNIFLIVDGTNNILPSLGDNKFWIGNGSSVATEITLSGDVVTTNLGVFTVDHDTITNYVLAQHRIINDASTSTTELVSASEVDSRIAASAESRQFKGGVLTDSDGVGDITLSGEQTINGETTLVSDVLLTEQSAGAENGPWVTAVGAWSRPDNFNGVGEANNGDTWVVSGPSSTSKGFRWTLTNEGTITIDTTVLTFVMDNVFEFGDSAGQAIEGNNTRVPSQDENDALVGTNGTPSTANKYVTNSDPRLAASITVFSSFKTASTVDTSSTATSAATADVVPEMTHTFTPADATNKVEAFFSGSFASNAAKDRAVFCGLFVDGTLEATTERTAFTFDEGQYPCTMAITWQGTLSVTSHTVDIRMWTTGDEVIAVDISRSMLIKEIDE